MATTVRATSVSRPELSSASSLTSSTAGNTLSGSEERPDISFLCGNKGWPGLHSGVRWIPLAMLLCADTKPSTSLLYSWDPVFALVRCTSQRTDVQLPLFPAHRFSPILSGPHFPPPKDIGSRGMGTGCPVSLWYMVVYVVYSPSNSRLGRTRRSKDASQLFSAELIWVYYHRSKKKW